MSSRTNARHPDKPPAPSWTQKYGDVCGECGRRNPVEKVNRGIVTLRKVRADRAHGRKKMPAPPSVPAGAITLQEIAKSMRIAAQQQAQMPDMPMPTPPPGIAQRTAMMNPTPPPGWSVPTPAPMPIPMPSRQHTPNPEEYAARRTGGNTASDTLSAELESELLK